MDSLVFKLRKWLGMRMGSRLPQVLLHNKTDYRFAEHYGDFHFGQSFDSFAIKGLAQESGKIYGAIVKFLREIPTPVRSVLLPGENNRVKPVYARMLDLDESRILTAGILDDMDVQWNFEFPPEFGQRFDCIVSQSMLEHLIDPYSHVRDCAALLNPGGHLVIHTMMPGFNYHRYPVDCFRFYPDWFEEVAKRLGLQVADKYIHNARITYKLCKPAQP
ncbi:MAG: methyltransferase domain-containing protein [Pseudomonadota bacterium]